MNDNKNDFFGSISIHTSEKLDDFFCSLSKLQGKLENAKKDKSGYLNRYKYADLTQYIDISKDLLEEHGFCVLQMPGTIEMVEVTEQYNDKKSNETVFRSVIMPKQKITTFLAHSSGQFISSTMEILVEKMLGNSWGQATGSSISYSRKYSLAGSLNMSQEDDDNQRKKQEDDRRSTPPRVVQEPSTTKLVNLIKSSGCDIEKFTKFYNISSKDLQSVKRAIDNFDELLVNFRDSERVDLDIQKEI